MSDQKPAWLHNPSKKDLTIVLAIYAVTVILLVLVMTNFFQESIFQRKNILFMLLLAGATGLPKQVYSNYRKQR
jgi:uncharacterized membrane protein